MQKKLSILFFSIITALSYTTVASNNGDEKETKIAINTTMGKIVVKLYNETPQSRDNFIKLVNKKFYDSTLFHRVIQQFMVQAGDPQSKHASPGVLLGNGDAGYTVPAEFRADLFHKKGALAMARQGDDVNPTKASSGCQFYIVQGKVFTNADLDMFEQRVNMGKKQEIFTHLMSMPKYAAAKLLFIKYQNENNIDSLRALSGRFEPIIDSIYNTVPKFQFTPEQRKIYTTVGGAPHLDGNYTVFGEVVEGLDIIDKIAAVKVDGNNRPVDDIRIISMEIVK
jgi:cyclophilin family peptidyl-prolyl cis-trans isomerase